MTYFLAKTEPSTYSIDDLKTDKKTEWDGVRNPAAVNAIKSMKPGDKVLIYHSGKDKAVVGLAEVTSPPRPDPNDDRSWVADFKYVAPRQEARHPQADQGIPQVRRLRSRPHGPPQHDVTPPTPSGPGSKSKAPSS